MMVALEDSRNRLEARRRERIVGFRPDHDEVCRLDADRRLELREAQRRRQVEIDVMTHQYERIRIRQRTLCLGKTQKSIAGREQSTGDVNVSVVGERRAARSRQLGGTAEMMPSRIGAL